MGSIENQSGLNPQKKRGKSLNFQGKWEDLCTVEKQINDRMYHNHRKEKLNVLHQSEVVACEADFERTSRFNKKTVWRVHLINKILIMKKVNKIC